MQKSKKMSRTIVALAMSAALALTACDASPDDPNNTTPTDLTTTTTLADLTTTTVAP